MSFIIIYVTYSNKKEANRIISHLLRKRLIACANLFPIKSYYLWKSKIGHSKEIVSLLKTRRENWQKIKAEIKKLHSYETPCIAKINAKANSEFESWINSETES